MPIKSIKPRSILYLTMAASYLLWCFTQNARLQVWFAVLLLVAVIFALPQCNQRTKWMGLVLFFLGALCLWTTNTPWQSWAVALSANGGLVVLFIALPLFSILLSFNDYLTAVERLFQNYVKKSFSFFTLAAVLAGLIGAVMNLGGITLMHELLHPNLKRYGDEKELAQALSRGNLSMSYWAPCHMSVATVVTYTGISWLSLVPRGLFLSFLQLVLIGLFFYLAGRKAEGRTKTATPGFGTAKAGLVEEGITNASLDNASRNNAGLNNAGLNNAGLNNAGLAKEDQAMLKELLWVYLGLIVWVAILNWQTSLPILAIITLSAYIYPLLIGRLLSKKDLFNCGWHDYVHSKLPKIVNQVTLFSAVGFFGKALELSGIGDQVIGLMHLDQIGSTVFLIAGIAFTMIFISMIGIHPLVSMIALATTLKPDLLGIDALTLAYTYLLGYSVGVVVSPFSAVALAISGLNGLDPWNGMSKHNLWYGAVLVILFSFVITWIT
jgi:DcuC family C4-dicarboxylate transporter